MTTQDELTELATRALSHLVPGLLVRTQESRFWSSIPDDQVLEGISVSAGINVSVGRGFDSIDVRTSYNVDALRQTGDLVDRSDDTEDEGWRSSVLLHGQWHAQETAALTDDELRAFAIKVGVMALHPYARAHIQATVVAAGWPTYTMDVLTRQEDLFAAEEDGEGVDLSLVGLG